ncbi:MAG: class C sortase [Oscillospiraceae bacterium]|nr:class C sortase [Oscillospiraceae bacterium]
MKKHILTAFVILFFLCGFGLMLYPTISNYFHAISQSKVVASYNMAVEQMNPEDVAKMLNEAKAYNKELYRDAARFDRADNIDEEYTDLLNISGNSVIGVLKIGLINVDLPIYHGSSESVLQVGLGHLVGSSLPIGGEATHAVITGHRGLPSAVLLSDLDRMREGDVFEIYVLNEILTYQVDQITVIEPKDFTELRIDPNKDYVTLLTCTPYGINSHRLLVRGVRVNPDEIVYNINADAKKIGTNQIMMIMLIPATIMALCVMFIKRKEKK